MVKVVKKLLPIVQKWNMEMSTLPLNIADI